MKKQTLEEAAKSIYPNNEYNDELYCDLGEYSRNLFIEGAKWKQEQDLQTHECQKDEDIFKNLKKIYEHQLSLKYSEKEVYDIVAQTIGRFCTYFTDKLRINITKEWFEQFKK